MDKRDSEIIHAIRRAKERYKVDLNEENLEEMVAQITNNESEFLKKKSNTRKEHNIIYNGATMRVVYDSRRKCIVTFLHLRPSKRDEKL